MSTDADFLRSFKPHYVYRCYNAAGELLYVGCTQSVARRMRQHATNSPWHPDVARIATKRYADRDRARHEERTAVSEELPLHNVIRFTTTPLGEYREASPEVMALVRSARALHAAS